MRETNSGGEGQIFSPRRQTPWLQKSDILALAFGTALVVGFASYTIQRDYRTTLDLWRSQLSAAVLYRAWTLRSSLQQSQDDAQLLADFAPAADLLLFRSNTNTQTLPRTLLEKQVLDLFGNYRKVYEYAALYLFDHEGRVVVQATDSAQWTMVVQSLEFKQVFGSVVKEAHYSVTLVRTAEQKLSLLFIMPVFAGSTPGQLQSAQRSLIGVIAVLDPFEDELLPLLKAKSFPTRSGETVLLQLHEGTGRYASPRQNAASSSTDQLSTSDTLAKAASSAVEDRPVFGQFVDYRGVDVIAAMQMISSIGSVIVYKVDDDEALADFYRRVRLGAIASAALLLAYAGLILVYRRNAVARETQTMLTRVQLITETLETTVAERTSQLAQINQKLQIELGEREKAEREVRELNTELELRVHDRTIELEEANKELEAFSYSIAHDLRAPLRAVNGFAGHVLKDFGPQLPDKGKNYLERIRNGGEKMNRLIDDLLAFSRLGRQPMHGRNVDTAELVRAVLEELYPQGDGRQIEIQVENLPPCYGDPALLKQVWANLLSNAIKYSRERKPAVIEIGCQRENDEDVYWVRDNGAGFDMAHAQRLFGVFQRLHGEAEFEGTGVGLAIVQRVVKRHGGRVWAEAEKDLGATFRFTLAGRRET